MLPTLLLMLREGIEGLLILAIAPARLRRTKRVAIGSAVYWGTCVGVTGWLPAGRLMPATWRDCGAPLSTRAA
jgi:hypothetical protein